MPPPRLPPLDPPPLLRLPPELRLPLLRLPEFRLPLELELDLLPTELELRFDVALLPEEPDFGFTVLPRVLEPLDFWVRELGLMLPVEPERLTVPELRDRLLPGRTWRVLSFRVLLWPVRPEFQTRVPLFRESEGLTARWLFVCPELDCTLRSVTAPVVRLPDEPPRTVDVAPEPRLTGTSPDPLLLPPARCRKPDSDVRLSVARPAVLERDAVVPPSRILRPELPLARVPASNWGRSRGVTLVSARLDPLAPAPASPLARTLPLPESVIFLRLLMASRCRESGVSELTIRLTEACRSVLVTGPPRSPPPWVRGL